MARKTGSSRPAPKPAQAHASVSRRRPANVFWLMLLAVIAVYVPIPSAASDNALLGLDFFQIHLHRIRFAQEHLFSSDPLLPAWYPRELLGTPFWSNIQSFPFIPSRLLLLAADPLLLYPLAVLLGAGLAATFTYLFARALGLRPLASSVAGWTFACSGFYASRVMAGHLPLLETYCGLPLLLWLVERHRQAVTTHQTRVSILSLGAATLSIVLGGHPQLPLYAVLAAGLYTLVRLRGWSRFASLLAVGLGAGASAFVWWPMLRLIGRSSRILALDPPSNNVAFPLKRLIAFLFPWRQGWPTIMGGGSSILTHFPSEAYFWDTVCYVGWLPLACVVGLTVRCIARRSRPAPGWLFITVLGLVGIALALPFLQEPLSRLPGVFLRSPARLLYWTTSALSMGVGAALDHLVRWLSTSKRARLGAAAVGAFVALHLVDLGWHDRYFVRIVYYPTRISEQDERIAQMVGDGRIAMDSALWHPLNRRLDDVGYFDSIALARPYTALIDLGGLPPGTNTQVIDGVALRQRALLASGVRLLMTARSLPGEDSAAARQGTRIFPLTGSLPRAQTIPLANVLFLDRDEIHRRLRDEAFDLKSQTMLPLDLKTEAPSPPVPAAVPPEAEYERRSSDSIDVRVSYDGPSVLRVLEAWDPGWSATLDGSPIPVAVADDVFLAVRLPPGKHAVRFEFDTPGCFAGAALSSACVIALGGLTYFCGRRGSNAVEIAT